MTGNQGDRVSEPCRSGAPAARGQPPASRRHGRPSAAPLLASWQRSEDYGVSLETVDPVFTGTYDTESLFFECGSEVLADLHATLGDEPVSLMLTDADGLVLNRLSGDRALLRALDDVHLAPGFAYSEREVGTNGLGPGAGRPGADGGAAPRSTTR